MVKLLKCVAVLPMSSVKCERGFSTQNRIMSRLRTSMNNTTIDDLMRIFEDGPRMELFDFGKALRKWKKEKFIYFFISGSVVVLNAKGSQGQKCHDTHFDVAPVFQNISITGSNSVLYYTCNFFSSILCLNLYFCSYQDDVKTDRTQTTFRTIKETQKLHSVASTGVEGQKKSNISKNKEQSTISDITLNIFCFFFTLIESEICKFICLPLGGERPHKISKVPPLYKRKVIYNSVVCGLILCKNMKIVFSLIHSQFLNHKLKLLRGLREQDYIVGKPERQTKRPGYRRLHEYRKGYDELDINTPAKRTKKSEVNKLYLIDILDEKIVDNMTYQKIHYIGYDNEEDEWRVKNDFVSLVRFDPDTVTDPTIKSDLIGLRNGLDNHLTNRAGKSHRVEFNTDCCEATFDYLKGLCNCAVQSEGLTVTKSDILNPAFGPDWIYRILNSAGDVCEISINSLRIKWMPGRLIKRFQYDEQQQVVERKILGASHIKIKFIRRDTKGTNLKKSHVAVALLERTLILEAAHVGEFTMLERLTTINEVNTRNQNVIEILCQLTFKELKGHLQKVCNKYKKFKDDKDCATFGSKNKVKQVGEEEEQIGRLKDSSELLTINYSLQRINVDMLHTQVNLKAYGNKPINVIGQVNCNIEFHERAENNSYWRRDSRTLAAAEKRGLNVPDNCELKCQLKYYEIKFSCVKGGRGYTSSSTGKRPHQSTFRAGCQSFIQVTYSKERHKLVIVNLNLEHNHAVNLSFR
ncbi:hypothetical protein GQR58_020932 [Nymphon striatum]|nr:hypothetical protein GQR58_020932 [Nymphon striatum]